MMAELLKTQIEKILQEQAAGDVRKTLYVLKGVSLETVDPENAGKPDLEKLLDNKLMYLFGIQSQGRRFVTFEEFILLGSLTALGVARSKLGDILISPRSADVIVCSDIADYLAHEWDRAGRVKLHVRRITPDALEVPERRVRTIRDTVATLRLDAVASSGFGMSRGRAAELIAAGRVQLNHRETAKPDAPVRAGDVVSARGVGKFTLAEVGGQSKKGRTAILIERFV
jgi:RNA-binding protein YlmH